MNRLIITMKWVIYLFCGVILLVQTVSAATYYVSITGNDSNPGTESQPWRTIQKAANAMVAGDKVIVNAGSYGETVTTQASGTSDNRITFLASGVVTTTRFRLNHNYITVNGFRITGTPSGYHGFHVSSGVSGCSILNNSIENMPPSSAGIYLHGTNNTVENNIISGGAYVNIFVFNANHTIRNNTIRDSTADAIYIFGHDHLVQGNYFYNLHEVQGGLHVDLIQSFGDNGEDAYNIIFENNTAVDINGQICNIEPKGRYIQNWTFRNNVFINVYAGANNYAPYVYFYNNTFYRVGNYYTQNPIQLRNGTKGTANNCKIINNLFIDCAGRNNMGWYSIDSGITGTEADYNYVTGPSPTFSSKTGFSETHGINGGDPRFVNISAYDFHLRDGSLAINSGSTLSGFSNDKDGIARPQGVAWDIGAYEFNQRPVKPVNLRILSD